MWISEPVTLQPSLSEIEGSIAHRIPKGISPSVLARILDEAKRHDLLILLDCHRLNDREIPGLWYGDGFTEKDWIDTWRLLARRYRNRQNIVGADLKNEPHGRASWGTDDIKTDWRLAAERAGNGILEVNPDWLIVVEGVEKNVPGQKLSGHWQGGNLEGVRMFPVRLAVPNKLVYSPHEYGPGVHNSAWFYADDFPENLYRRWELDFYYIVQQGIAPVWARYAAAPHLIPQVLPSQHHGARPGGQLHARRSQKRAVCRKGEGNPGRPLPSCTPLTHHIPTT